MLDRRGRSKKSVFASTPLMDEALKSIGSQNNAGYDINVVYYSSLAKDYIQQNVSVLVASIIIQSLSMVVC